MCWWCGVFDVGILCRFCCFYSFNVCFLCVFPLCVFLQCPCVFLCGFSLTLCVVNVWSHTPSPPHPSPHPPRHCGHVLLLAHVLGTQPAVLTCKDTQEIRHEVHRLLCNPVEARSRGYAAATAASRLTRGMVATVLGLFGTKILEPQLRQQ